MPDRSITVRLRLQDDYSGPIEKAAKSTGDFTGAADAAEKSGGIFDAIKEKITDLVGGSDSLGESLKGLAAGFAGGIVGGGIAEGFGGIAESMMGAVDAASDLNETVNKSQAIFGAQAGSVEQWANSAATSFGLSKGEALDYAAALGDMFTQLGNSGAESAKMSEKVVKLAADLGSFNNLDTGDVLERIQAGFRGEYDSLQQLVPNINAARVQTEALNETGKTNASQLTAQEKATATLNIITKDTSRAQGDFARTAHQAANQSKINAAQVKDLQAKVGQGLLPAYKAFLNLIGQVGLPALSSLVDAGGAVVQGIGPVVGLFKDLPGPVKTATALLVAFGLANRVLGGRLSGLTGRVRSFGGALREMSTNQGAVVRTAQTGAVQMGRFGSAIERAGRSAPSIARMQGAFVDAAAGANRFPRAAGAAAAAMSGIRSAGRGLVGFLGGPFGVAMIGAGVLLMAWQKHQQDAARAAAEHQQRVEELTEAIKKDGNELGKAAAEQISKNLVDSDTIGLAKQMGISQATLTKAWMGQPAAMKSVNSTLDTYKSKALQTRKADGTLTAGAHERIAAIEKVRDGMNGQVKDTGDVIAKNKEYARSQKVAADALKQSNKQQREAPASAREYASALKEATTAQKNAKNAATDMVEALDRVNNKFLELRGGERGYEAAIDDAAAALKKNGKTLDDNTAKGRDNAAALDQIASSAQDVLAKMGDKGMSARSIAAEYKRQHGELVKMAKAFGMNATDAKKYADQALTLPKEVKTKIVADITKAQANLKLARAAAKDLGVDFDALPKTIQTKLVTTNSTNAKQVIKDYIDTTKGVPPGLHLKVDTPGADAAMLRLKKLTVTALDTNGKVVQIPVKTPGQAEALHAIIDVRDAAVKTDGKKITITSDAPLAKDTKKKIDDLRGAQVSADGKSIVIDSSLPTYSKTLEKIRGLLGAAKPKSFTVTAKDARFEHVLHQLGLVDAAAKDKTFSVTAVFKEIHPGDNLSRHGLDFARGGIVDHGVQKMAAGGVRQAMFSDKPILWGEAGLELYAPLAKDSRAPRAIRLIGEGADFYGYQLIPKGARRAADGWSSWRDARPVSYAGIGGLSDRDIARLASALGGRSITHESPTYIDTLVAADYDDFQRQSELTRQRESFRGRRSS